MGIQGNSASAFTDCNIAYSGTGEHFVIFSSILVKDARGWVRFVVVCLHGR
jgi:hypothetical protein